MRRVFSWELTLSTVLLLLVPLKAYGLPDGCGGTLEILNFTSGGFQTSSNPTAPVWTCVDIVPPLFQSGQNTLYFSGVLPNETVCADECVPFYATAGIWIPHNNSCTCWTIGDGTVSLDETADPEANATYIQFWPPNTPSAAQYWGVFTCPEGAIYLNEGTQGVCGPLEIIPAQPPLGQLGPTGCPSGSEWTLLDPTSIIDTWYCYGDLAGLKYYYNYSSSYTITDLYDFTTHPTPTSSLKTAGTTTSKHTTTTNSGNTSSSKSSSKPSPTSTLNSSKSSVVATKSSVVTTKSSSKSSSMTTARSSSKSSSKLLSTSTKASTISTKIRSKSLTSSTHTITTH